MTKTHIHIYCQELEPVIKFFTDGLGGKLDNKRIMGGDPGAEITLAETRILVRAVGKTYAPQDCDAKVCGYNHFGLMVDDLDATLAKLLAMPDIQQHGEPFIVAARKRRGVYLTGPSGLYVELLENMK